MHIVPSLTPTEAHPITLSIMEGMKLCWPQQHSTSRCAPLYKSQPSTSVHTHLVHHGRHEALPAKAGLNCHDEHLQQRAVSAGIVAAAVAQDMPRARIATHKRHSALSTAATAAANRRKYALLCHTFPATLHLQLNATQPPRITHSRTMSIAAMYGSSSSTGVPGLMVMPASMPAACKQM